MMKAREGFSLIETMVAMTIFAVVMLGMAQMSAAVAVKGRTNDVVAKRNAVLQLEANKMGAVTFASLKMWPTTDKTFTHGTFSYTRRMTIIATGINRYTVKVVIIPTVDPSKKDSVIIERSLAPSGSPLCVGC
jgi:prepilin-type N-terminal cleavage/methylation domain-containing protein